MKTKIFSSLAVIVLLPFLALAQDSPRLTVEDIRICTAVEEREPAGADTSFARDIGHLYCFTRVSGDSDYATLYHVWYYRDREMLKVELNTKAKSWRTWSTKRIPDSSTGAWRVDVQSSDGTVLGSMEFTIRE